MREDQVFLASDRPPSPASPARVVGEETRHNDDSMSLDWTLNMRRKCSRFFNSAAPTTKKPPATKMQTSLESSNHHSEVHRMITSKSFQATRQEAKARHVIRIDDHLQPEQRGQEAKVSESQDQCPRQQRQWRRFRPRPLPVSLLHLDDQLDLIDSPAAQVKTSHLSHRFDANEDLEESLDSSFLARTTCQSDNLSALSASSSLLSQLLNSSLNQLIEIDNGSSASPVEPNSMNYSQNYTRSRYLLAHNTPATVDERDLLLVGPPPPPQQATTGGHRGKRAQSRQQVSMRIKTGLSRMQSPSGSSTLSSPAALPALKRSVISQNQRAGSSLGRHFDTFKHSRALISSHNESRDSHCKPTPNEPAWPQPEPSELINHCSVDNGAPMERSGSNEEECCDFQCCPLCFPFEMSQQEQTVHSREQIEGTNNCINLCISSLPVSTNEHHLAEESQRSREHKRLEEVPATGLAHSPRASSDTTATANSCDSTSTRRGIQRRSRRRRSSSIDSSTKQQHQHQQLSISSSSAVSSSFCSNSSTSHSPHSQASSSFASGSACGIRVTDSSEDSSTNDHHLLESAKLQPHLRHQQTADNQQHLQKLQEPRNKQLALQVLDWLVSAGGSLNVDLTSKCNLFLPLSLPTAANLPLGSYLHNSNNCFALPLSTASDGSQREREPIFGLDPRSVPHLDEEELLGEGAEDAASMVEASAKLARVVRSESNASHLSLSTLSDSGSLCSRTSSRHLNKTELLLNAAAKQEEPIYDVPVERAKSLSPDQKYPQLVQKTREKERVIQAGQFPARLLIDSQPTRKYENKCNCVKCSDIHQFRLSQLPIVREEIETPNSEHKRRRSRPRHYKVRRKRGGLIRWPPLVAESDGATGERLSLISRLALDGSELRSARQLNKRSRHRHHQRRPRRQRGQRRRSSRRSSSKKCRHCHESTCSTSATSSSSSGAASSSCSGTTDNRSCCSHCCSFLKHQSRLSLSTVTASRADDDLNLITTTSYSQSRSSASCCRRCCSCCSSGSSCTSSTASDSCISSASGSTLCDLAQPTDDTELGSLSQEYLRRHRGGRRHRHRGSVRHSHGRHARRQKTLRRHSHRSRVSSGRRRRYSSRSAGHRRHRSSRQSGGVAERGLIDEEHASGLVNLESGVQRGDGAAPVAAGNNDNLGKQSGADREHEHDDDLRFSANAASPELKRLMINVNNGVELANKSNTAAGSRKGLDGSCELDAACATADLQGQVNDDNNIHLDRTSNNRQQGSRRDRERMAAASKAASSNTGRRTPDRHELHRVKRQEAAKENLLPGQQVKHADGPLPQNQRRASNYRCHAEFVDATTRPFSSNSHNRYGLTSNRHDHQRNSRHSNEHRHHHRSHHHHHHRSHQHNRNHHSHSRHHNYRGGRLSSPRCRSTSHSTRLSSRRRLDRQMIAGATGRQSRSRVVDVNTNATAWSPQSGGAGEYLTIDARGHFLRRAPRQKLLIHENGCAHADDDGKLDRVYKLKQLAKNQHPTRGRRAGYPLKLNRVKWLTSSSAYSSNSFRTASLFSASGYGGRRGYWCRRRHRNSMATMSQLRSMKKALHLQRRRKHLRDLRDSSDLVSRQHAKLDKDGRVTVRSKLKYLLQPDRVQQEASGSAGGQLNYGSGGANGIMNRFLVKTLTPRSAMKEAPAIISRSNLFGWQLARRCQCSHCCLVEKLIRLDAEAKQKRKLARKMLRQQQLSSTKEVSGVGNRV